MPRHLLVATILTGALVSFTQANGVAPPFVQIDGTDLGGFNPFVFTFLDADAPGTVSSAGTDLLIDMTDTLPVDNRLGGGLGFVFMPELQFDASLAQLVVELTIGASNTAESFNVALLDNDGSTSLPFGEAELHGYAFPEIETLPKGVRHKLTRPLVPPTFNLSLGGSPTEGIVNFDANGGLVHLQIDSFSDTADRFQLTIHELRIEPIPEPASIGLGTVCILILTSFRRLATEELPQPQ